VIMVFETVFLNSLCHPEPVEEWRRVLNKHISVIYIMARDHNYFVYIVECVDGLYYTGVTNNLDRRIQEHNEGIDPKAFTFKRRPVTLRYFQRFSDIHQAIEWEKQLKGWSRKKKEALFKEDWDEIKRLAKSSLRQAQTDIESTSFPCRQVFRPDDPFF